MHVHAVVRNAPVDLNPVMRKCIDATRVRGIKFKWRKFKKELQHLPREVQEAVHQRLDSLCADPVPPEACLVGYGTGLFSAPVAGGDLLYWVKLNLSENTLHIVPV